jgi:hypothetical protein
MVSPSPMLRTVTEGKLLAKAGLQIARTVIKERNKNRCIIKYRVAFYAFKSII